MKMSIRSLAVWGVFVALLTVGFVAAAGVGEVSILPMPREGAAEEAAPPDEMAAETASEDDRAREAWEEQAAGGSGTEPNTTEAQVEAVEEGPSDALPVIEPAWTEEELRALRELARERIAVKELMAQVSEYLKGFWDEEVGVWLDGAFSERTGKAVEEAGELAREWLEAQRDLAREFAEDVKELREALRGGDLDEQTAR